jgi:predicted Zn-dependent peptidase
MDAFNMYFGGDFSGLVLQEIREYRSLAYTAGARFGVPALRGKESYFTAYVGTQADKTLDALGVFDTLIHHMPMKEERTAMIRQYLLQSSVTERPGFRTLSVQVLRWQNQGFTYDPARYKRDAYEKLSFDNIRNFYQANLAVKPLAIGIVGDKKKIDLDKLSNYGKLIFVKESSLFRD